MSEKISVVVITKNEEENIERCLSSVKSVADEIIVVDSKSTDKTVAISEKLGAKVIVTEWMGYAATKNLGNNKASHNYILSLDADEALSPSLALEIIRLKENGLQGTYSMKRKTNYCGSWVLHSGWYPDVKIRLFNKTNISWTGEFVHETLNIPNGEDDHFINEDIFHYSYKDMIDHRERADKYSALTAQKFFSEGKTAGFLKPMISLISRFFKMYILKLGVLDGLAGLRIAKISAISNKYKYEELRRLYKKNALSRKIDHICISRTDSLGDVMLTLPLAGVLKKEFSHIKISFLGKNYTEPLVNSCIYIDKFISFDELSKVSVDEQLDQLKSQKIDAVIHVLPNKPIAQLFKKLRTRFRIGTSRRLYNIPYCNKFVHYTRRNSALHESQLNILMASKLHCQTQFSFDEISEIYGFSSNDQFKVQSLDLDQKRNIILHPKSQGSAPEWNLKNFQSLANSLSKKGFKVYITGTEKEGELIRQHFEFTENIIDVSGKFNLNEFIWFIDQCQGLVAASTGPLHIAAALKLSCVGLYTTQRPMHGGRWQPIGEKTQIISSQTENNELQISPENVLSTLLDSISGSK